MPETAYQKYFKPLPNWSKGVIVLIVVAGAAVATWSIVKGIKRAKELKDANKAGAAAEDELQQLASQGIKPTMDDSRFQALSETLVQAMNGCGTDNDMVFDVFRQIKNDADIRKLISIFGVRFYEPCAGDAPLSYIRWQFNDKAFGGGLPTWLAYDLTAGEIRTVNSILSANNVNYAF